MVCLQKVIQGLQKVTQVLFQNSLKTSFEAFISFEPSYHVVSTDTFLLLVDLAHDGKRLALGSLLGDIPVSVARKGGRDGGSSRAES